jgi:hypothetical protein
MIAFFPAQLTVYRRRITSGMMLALLVLALTSNAMPAWAQGTWYGPYDDGCHYLWDGTQWVEAQCQQADGSFHSYVLSANAWVFSGSIVTDASGVIHVTSADGSYVALYPDGSQFVMLPNRFYVVYATDGKLPLEVGYVDAAGTRVRTGYFDASGAFVNVTAITSPSTTSPSTTSPSTGTGASTTTQENNQLIIDTIVSDANQRVIDRLLAPACTSSPNGCGP